MKYWFAVPYGDDLDESSRLRDWLYEHGWQVTEWTFESRYDHTGLSGTLDVADLSDMQRLNHLENCPYSVVAGPIGCEQDCTSTGTGMEILTAQAGCPHGAPITVRTGSYGTGGLLDKMIALGQRINDERAGSDDDDQ